MPPRIDATSTLPLGYGVYENTTFATSCAWNDPACYAKCTAMVTACGSKWFMWTSRNSFLDMTVSPTSLSTTMITSQSYTYSPSVVLGRTFRYASPIGKPYKTVTSVYTQNSVEQIVTRWTEAPPTCTPSAWMKCTKGPDCRACTVQGGTVDVLFWPPASETASNETIGFSRRNVNNGSLVTHYDIAQPVVTAMFGTHTLTSPSVYVSFQTAYALNDCGQTVGKARPGALLPMDPQSLSTMLAGYDYFEVTSGGTQSRFYASAPFNYNDFTGPVPVSVYTQQPSCLAQGCYTIYSDYRPQLVLPPQIRSMDPAWENCALDWRGSWDPPIALHKADAIAVPTMPVEVTFTEPASPKSTVSAPAAMTSAPVELGHPSGASLTTIQSHVSSSTSARESGPLFTYLPLSPSDDSQTESGVAVSQRPSEGGSAPQIIQTTKVIQIDPKLDPSDIVASQASTLDLSHELSTSKSDNPAHSTQQSINPSSNPAPQATETNGDTHLTINTAYLSISKAPNNGLALAHTTLTAGGEALTLKSVIYSALSGDDLLVISNTPAAAVSTHSPTNAYEVLSEALGSAEGSQTLSSGGGNWDGKTSSTISLGDPTSEQPTRAPLPEAILDFTSTTLTVTLHASSILQIGTQFLSGKESAITVGSHTLSTASNGIILDGITATFTQQSSVPTRGIVQGGTLGVSRADSSIPTSLQTLPGVQESRSTEVRLPSVTTEPTLGSGGAEAAPSDGGADENSSESSADRSRQIRHLPWLGVVIMLLGGTW
jgi:hypothetical protein